MLKLLINILNKIKPKNTNNYNYNIYLEKNPLGAQSTEYKCPYCDRKSASPGGVRFHVKLTHPEKLEEFNEKYYAEMESRFKAPLPES